MDLSLDPIYLTAERPARVNHYFLRKHKYKYGTSRTLICIGQLAHPVMRKSLVIYSFRLGNETRHVDVVAHLAPPVAADVRPFFEFP